VRQKLLPFMKEDSGGESGRNPHEPSESSQAARASKEVTETAGPLSPLLANLLLDEWDRELDRRGHRFCRYADSPNRRSACRSV
jgi:hypothetical protein